MLFDDFVIGVNATIHKYLFTLIYIYVVRSPYRRSTVIHRRKNNCVSILINFIQYQPI